MKLDKVTSLNRQPAKEIEYGSVQSLVDDQFVVHSQDDIFMAKRAFSCVVNPEVGDKVMYCCDDHQQCHILAVIERPAHQNATLAFQGDIAIDSARGSLSITGKEGIQMASAESVTMVSDNINVLAKKGLINISDVAFTGEKATSHISSLSTFAKSIDTVADRLSQKLKNSFRMIEGVDQTKAGDVLTTIKNLFSLRSRQSAILAKKDIKIDAVRIHMG